jgi:hypothetical protein
MHQKGKRLYRPFAGQTAILEGQQICASEDLNGICHSEPRPELPVEKRTGIPYSLRGRLVS